MGILRSLAKIKIDQPTFRLAGVALASLTIYILAFFLPANLFENYTRTRLELKLLAGGGSPAYARMVLVFIMLAVLYIIGFRSARRTQSRAAWAIVIIGALAFTMILLLIAPFDAADIYDNIFHGRIRGVYGANPYQQVIADYPQDPFYDYTAWKRSTSAYGPVWELLAGLAARWAGDRIIPNVLTFKLLPGLFYFASVAIIWGFLRQTQPEFALAGVLLLAWNPVVLYETWGNGHNDMAMTVWILAAVWFVSMRRYSLSVISLTFGAMVKYIPLLLIPAAVVVGLRDQENRREQYLFLLKSTILTFVIVVIAYFPFREAGDLLDVERRARLFTTSIPAVVYKALRPTLGIDTAANLVTLGTLFFLGIFVLYQSLRRTKTESANPFLMTVFNILVYYLMVACLWFQQWYGLWLVTLAALLPKHARRLALFFGFWVLSKQLIFAPKLVPRIIHQPEWAAGYEALLTIAVLGAPWIYALSNLKRFQQIRSSHDRT
jgi:hypothetical protein